MGPPESKRGGDPTPGTARHHHHPHNTTRHHPSGFHDATNRRSQPACYAAAWRRVYARGFRDALRLAERRLGPEAWHTLSQLADEYDLVGADE
jgi:hypothetical protein